jgi:hypothetical protein
MNEYEVVSYKGLKELFGLPYSRTHMPRLEAKGFPKSFKLDDPRGGRKVWWKREVIAWLKSRDK